MSLLTTRHRTLRRLAAVAATLAVLPAVTLTASPAHAAPVAFKVVGTADVSDSRLMANVIEPQFEAAYPQYDLQYTSMGTGDALNAAKSGTFSATIVHAASLENTWVSQGYSLEPFGRSLFWGDFVLLGPASDPAGVLSGGGQHDIVTAFEKIAAAGTAGHATFVSRGTTAGTVVQEHSLWSLTSGVPTCTETSGNGGGSAPSNTPGACPATLNSTNYPSWYKVTGANQAANVQAADSCPTATFPNGGCYVFTDRGTYDYLQSTGALSKLVPITRGNASTARGGTDALYNFFHGYAVNPAAVTTPGTVDTTAAKLFLDFITSPAEQQNIGAYLNASNDPPFIPAAAPKLTASITGQTKSGSLSTVTGQLTNNMPGYPALNGVAVNLLEATSNSPLAIPRIVATGATNATGGYSIRATLHPGDFYSVGVGSITKTERPDLSPPFSDTLQPTTSPVGTASAITLKQVKPHGRVVLVSGKVTPRTTDATTTVSLYAKKKGKKLKLVKVLHLKAGKGKFHIRTHLAKGSYKVEVVLADGTVLLPSVSKTKSVKVS